MRLGWCVVLAVLACGWRAEAQWLKSPLDRQREAAGRMQPADIVLRDHPRPGAVGEVRVLRLRVYASADYREQTLQWKAHLQRTIARVNSTLAAWPGVRFEIVDFRRWDRQSATVPLERLLQDLESLDPARDVDWVVGLAAATPIMPTQIHNIGMARELGRHFVIRSLHDLAEYDLMRTVFDQMPSVDRDQLVAARKAHKEVVVFLHEWAHTLGIIHAQSWQRIMNPAYHQGMARFSDTEAQMLELALQYRDEPDLGARLIRLVTDSPDPEWDPRDRQHLLALLASEACVVKSQVGVEAAQPALGAVHSWEQIRSVLEQHLDDRRMQTVGCELAAAHQPAVPSAIVAQVCSRAATLDGSDAAPLLSWAEAERRAHIDDHAEEILALAEKRLSSESAVVLWEKATALRRELLSPSLAVADALHTPAGAATAEWADQARRLWLIPAESAALGLSPEREGEYARQVRLILAALDEKQDDTAELLARQVASAFPRLPLGPMVACVVDERRGRFAKAEAECAAALASQADAIPTQTALAELHLRRRRARELRPLGQNP